MSAHASPARAIATVAAGGGSLGVEATGDFAGLVTSLANPAKDTRFVAASLLQHAKPFNGWREAVIAAWGREKDARVREALDETLERWRESD